MNAQQRFDATVARAMTRRAFLAHLARASSVAILASSSPGCGTMRGRASMAEGLRLENATLVFDPVQREVIAKIIDGINPPDTEIRRRLKQEDPEYDPVAVFEQFAWTSGDEFVGHMKTLIDFLNILPAFTRNVPTRQGVFGQVVNTHRFARPGTEDAGK